MKGINLETGSKGITVAEYVSNLQTDKQVYDENHSGTDDYLDANETETVVVNDFESEQDTEVNILETLNPNELADVIVDTINISYNVFSRIYSQGHVDTQDFEARPDELRTLKKSWAKFLKTKDINVSPGTALLIAIVIIYAPKTFMLVQAKKQAKKELKEKNAENSNV